jgi:porin
MSKKRLAVSAAILLISGMTEARAQEASEGGEQGGNSASTLPVFAEFNDLHDKLSKYGVNFRGAIINETATNPVGGLRQGTTNVGQGQLGADFDLQRILGIPGGSLHVTEYHDYGSSLSLDYIGNGIRVQEIYKNQYTIFHEGLLSYEQKMFDDRLDLVGGRIGTTAFFAHLEYACRFMSGTQCGVPLIINSESGFSKLPSATWGARALYHVTSNFSVQTGAFEVNNNASASAGTDFRTNASSGVTVPVEFEYGTSFATDAYPFDVKLGFYYSNAKFSDLATNTAGKSLALFGGTAASVQTRSGAYVLASKTITRENDSDHRGITLIGGAVQPFDTQELYTTQIFGGAVWNGPLAFRPNDSIGFVANYFRLSNEEATYLDQARMKVGGFGTNNQNMFTLEANYGITPVQGVRITPDVQYLINPDNSANAFTKSVPGNAWVFGIKAEAVFGDRPFAPPGRPGETKSLSMLGDGGNDDGAAISSRDAFLPGHIWSGLYGGPQLGYEFGNDFRFANTTLSAPASSPKDVIFGGHIGYNLTLPAFVSIATTRTVVGIESDVDGTTGQKTYTLLSGVTGSYRDTVQGSIRGRLGIDFGRALLYGTGGFAVGHIRNTYTATGALDNAIIWRPAFTVGTGVEYALNPHWSVRCEYRYTGFADSEQILSNTERGRVTVTHQDADSRIQGGISYLFDTQSSMGLLAKY